jgi:hypothetical protein
MFEGGAGRDIMDAPVAQMILGFASRKSFSPR